MTVYLQTYLKEGYLKVHLFIMSLGQSLFSN